MTDPSKGAVGASGNSGASAACPGFVRWCGPWQFTRETGYAEWYRWYLDKQRRLVNVCLELDYGNQLSATPLGTTGAVLRGPA